MRKLALVTLFAMVLSACAGSQYGNFTQNLATVDAKIADDAALQLSTLYPAASTRFNVQQETTDAFGGALIGALREKGYAVFEYVAPDRLSATAEAPANRDGGVELRYVLDYLGADHMYSITLRVDNRALSRAYVEKDATALAAGAWTRKE